MGTSPYLNDMCPIFNILLLMFIPIMLIHSDDGTIREHCQLKYSKDQPMCRWHAIYFQNRTAYLHSHSVQIRSYDGTDKKHCQLKYSKNQPIFGWHATLLLGLVRVEWGLHGDAHGIAEVDHDEGKHHKPLLAAVVRETGEAAHVSKSTKKELFKCANLHMGV